MLQRLKDRIHPPVLNPEEKEQRRRILNVLLWVELGVSVLIGLINLALKALPETIMLFTTAAACIPALVLNGRDRYWYAAGIATAMVFVTMNQTLYAAGGLHDPAVVAIPIFVMLGTLLFSRRVLPYLLLAATASVIWLGVMEVRHQTDSGMLIKDTADMVVITVLTMASGFIVSVTIGNLEENLRRARTSEKDVRVAYDRTLEGWSRAMEYRDRTTHGHAQRVVRLCMRLAEEWELDEEQLSHVYRGALLHDIGKMAVPDEILLKPGPLSRREMEVMRKHPVVARALLGQIPYLRPALAIPASHHERWDGTGYPRGWRGTRIPLEARIFAVVDQYDALTSDRPYRKAWPRRRAIDYLRANAGRAFDPQVCEVFLQLYEAKAFGADI